MLSPNVLMLTSTKSPSHRLIELRGGNLDTVNCRLPEVLLHGPAGTGKSFAILLKLYLLCERVKNLRVLLIRKYRASLTDTALVTWEDDVLPENHPTRGKSKRSLRHSYEFQNGTQVICGGMDKSEKVLSSQYDFIYCQEATELEQNDWETLTTRLRNFKGSYTQLLGDCNPSHPRHWLKIRADSGKTKLLRSRLEDNPAYYKNGKWTDSGEKYRALLEGLTGHRRKRLFEGEWCAAEGVVYESFDEQRHTIEYTPKRDDTFFCSIDFGFNHFQVCQWWAVTDDRIILYRELVRCNTTVEDFAREVVALNREPLVAIVCDHDREDRATFEKHTGWITVPAFKDIEFGIHRVQEYLLRKRLAIEKNSLVSRDSHTISEGKPQGFLEEIVGYVWAENKLVGLKEVPVDKNNHSMDAARYAVCWHWMRDSGAGFIIR